MSTRDSAGDERFFREVKRRYLSIKASAERIERYDVMLEGMRTIVAGLGDMVNRIADIRAKIELGEGSLRAFDRDLAELRARYSGLYRRFFDDVSDPSTWGVVEWTSYEEDVEGPVLLWSRTQCEEQWEVSAFTTPCEGPDLLLALRLQNQAIEAWDGQIKFSEEHPFGAFLLRMQAFGIALLNDSATVVREIGEGVVEEADVIAQEVKKSLTRGVKRVAQESAFPLLALAGAGGVALYLWSRSRAPAAPVRLP